jgi:hypothetical protein
MNTTNTTDIYAPGNEHLWERAVRDALDKVRPGMGEAAESGDDYAGRPYLVGLIPDMPGVEVSAVWQRSGTTGLTITDGERGAGWGGVDPLTCWCLALCEYRRQLEGVTT